VIDKKEEEIPMPKKKKKNDIHSILDKLFDDIESPESNLNLILIRLKGLQRRHHGDALGRINGLI
jgi:hypothetical protein